MAVNVGRYEKNIIAYPRAPGLTSVIGAGNRQLLFIIIFLFNRRYVIIRRPSGGGILGGADGREKKRFICDIIIRARAVAKE